MYIRLLSIASGWISDTGLLCSIGDRFTNYANRWIKAMMVDLDVSRLRVYPSIKLVDFVVRMFSSFILDCGDCCDRTYRIDTIPSWYLLEWDKFEVDLANDKKKLTLCRWLRLASRTMEVFLQVWQIWQMFGRCNAAQRSKRVSCTW